MNFLKRRDRRVILAVADTHGGHSLGLLNPETKLVAAYDDDGTPMYWCPTLTRTQKRLWPLFLEIKQQAVDYADGCEIVVIHAGDPTNGEKHPEGNIPGLDMEDHRNIAFWNLKPLFALPNVKKGRLYTGTAAHVEPGFSDSRVADKLAREFPGKEIKSVHHTRSHVGDEIIDGAHTGPHPGSRDWLRGNVANLYLRDRVYRDRRMNKTPATVYLRAHRHVYVHVTYNDMWWHTPSVHHLVVVPSFCGFTSYARGITQSEPELVNGMVALEITDGKLTEIKPFVDYTDLRLEETL